MNSSVTRRILFLAVIVALLAIPLVAQDDILPATGINLDEVSVASEYPEGVALSEVEPRKFALDEIMTYEALDSYSEPEWITELVEAGELPPVEERLPNNPQVVHEGFMSSGIGQYGGVWRDFSAVATEGWNLCAGQTQGWFGINYIYAEALTETGPMFLRSDSPEPLPNLATDWEWSEDGMQLTMNIISGAKWSDGDPFDTEDIMFTWEHVILDPNVNSWTSRTSWQINGEDITLEALDEDTIVWTFPVARPVAKLFDMDFLDFNVCPAHAYMPEHPAFNEDATYDSFQNFQTATDLPVPTMGPWVPVEYRVDEFMVMRRNPYYWKVDSAGQQLPYLDEVTFEKGETGLGRTLGTLAGSLDHTNLENPSSYGEAMARLQDDDATFYIEWGPESLFFSLELNLSANLGIQSERDEALRALFRDLRFRRALTHAIDREGVAQSVIRGPFLRGFPGGLAPGSLYYDRSSVAFYEYDPEVTRTLLADLGFEDTDGDGILNWTTGPLAGENLVLALNAGQDAAAQGQIAEALIVLFQDIGIQVNYRPLEGTVIDDNAETGTWEMRIIRSGQEWTAPFTRCRDLAPVTAQTPGWHREGAEARVLMDFEQELIDIVNQFCLEADPAVRQQLMSDYNRIFTENVYTIGTVLGRYGLALANRFENVPVGTPAFFYQWTWGNAMPYQVWVAPENQLEQILPGVIPTYD